MRQDNACECVGDPCAGSMAGKGCGAPIYEVPKGTVREELAAELYRYSVTCDWWSGLADQAEATGEAESVADCQRYDDKMREHAGVFAHLASVLLKYGDQAPAYPGAGLVAERAEPLGPPNPADGELPDDQAVNEHDDLRPSPRGF